MKLDHLTGNVVSVFFYPQGFLLAAKPFQSFSRTCLHFSNYYFFNIMMYPMKIQIQSYTVFLINKHFCVGNNSLNLSGFKILPPPPMALEFDALPTVNPPISAAALTQKYFNFCGAHSRAALVSKLNGKELK